MAKRPKKPLPNPLVPKRDLSGPGAKPTPDVGSSVPPVGTASTGSGQTGSAATGSAPTGSDQAGASGAKPLASKPTASSATAPAKQTAPNPAGPVLAKPSPAKPSPAKPVIPQTAKIKPTAPQPAANNGPSSKPVSNPPTGAKSVGVGASKTTAAPVAAKPAAKATPQPAVTKSGSAKAAPAKVAPAKPAPAKAGISAEELSDAVPRKQRIARLRLVQIDAWSVMQTSFVLSIALGIVQIVAVAIVWFVLGQAGVFDSINSMLQDVIGGEGKTFDITTYFGTSRVIGFTMLAAVLNVVLLTALSTLAAFLYNLAATLLGGVEVTWAEDR